ncbi:MAG: hypothetical protein ACI81R_003617, partial [Bradymonadia bacterium]
RGVRGEVAERTVQSVGVPIHWAGDTVLQVCEASRTGREPRAEDDERERCCCSLQKRTNRTATRLEDASLLDRYVDDLSRSPVAQP